jgi:peptidoglycan/xylan/chitin deacetylase (PgdA/CDA1 family)
MLERFKRWAGRLPLQDWLPVRGEPVVVVLMYHDLRADDDFANWMRVSTTDFEKQLDACREMGAFLDPEALLETRPVPGDGLSFLVTFDDGYRNNAELAVPILKKREIRALFFISTGPMISRRLFWTDIIVTPVQALRLKELDLRDQGFGLFEFRQGCESKRWDDIQRLLTAIKRAGNEDHHRVARLLSWMQDRFEEVLKSHGSRLRPLSRQEIQGMADGGCCSFGSHGHDHRILTRLNDDELACSLVHSREILSDATGQTVLQLAYPNGDHDARVMAAAERAGYRRAYGIRSGFLAGKMAALSLPRIAVGAFDTAEIIRFKVYRRLIEERRLRHFETLEFVNR